MRNIVAEHVDVLIDRWRLGYYTTDELRKAVLRFCKHSKTMYERESIMTYVDEMIQAFEAKKL